MIEIAQSPDPNAAIILVVDDDPTHRTLARGHLEIAGFEVVEADTGTQGLETARRIRPDLVILDVMMPELDGFSVCREIRRDSEICSTPVLISTGLDNLVSIEQGFDAGATDFLTKPIRWPLLGYRVKFLLRTSRMERDLRDAKVQAEAANIAKSAFLANMSHELRTPLNAVMGFAEVMREETLGPIGNEQYKEYSADIHNSAEHLLGIIGDVLDLSKSEHGSLILDDDIADPEKIIQAALTQSQPAAQKAGVTLHSNIAAPLPNIRGDFRRLTQVLLNLLSNAVKFTPAGGDVRVTSCRSTDGGIEISVSDSGIGFAMDELPTIIQPFTQLENTFHKSYDGTGLGIPISMKIAKLHRGSLTYASTPGQGTTATLKLPADRIIVDAPPNTTGRSE